MEDLSGPFRDDASPEYKAAQDEARANLAAALLNDSRAVSAKAIASISVRAGKLFGRRQSGGSSQRKTRGPVTPPQDNGLSGDPALSILVVNWNRAEMTLECVASVHEHTRDVAYEVIVVDNGSEPAQAQILEENATNVGFRLIRLGQNLYFGEANNIAAEAARGDVLLLLNNDVTVSHGYIRPMLDALRDGYRAGAVGPKFIYPNGRLQEAGGYVRADGHTIRHGNVGPPVDSLCESGRHIVDYCSAACLVIRREIFLQAAGFDPSFDPGYFEDVDLMLRLRAAGLFTYLCADVTVIHDENSTSASVWNPQQFRRTVSKSHRTFIERWGAYVARRALADMPHIPEISWEPDIGLRTERPVIALLGPGLVRRSAVWLGMMRFAATLSERAHILFAADEACSRSRLYRLACEAGVRLGPFSVEKRSTFELEPSDTVLEFDIGAAGELELLSQRGPLAAAAAAGLKSSPI